MLTTRFGSVLAVGLLLVLCALVPLGFPRGSPPPDSLSTVPLPQAPGGLRVREVAAFHGRDQEPVRVAGHPTRPGRLYVLGAGGDIYMVDAGSGAKHHRVLAGAD